MAKLELITKHTVADTATQRVTRSSVMGGISLENYSIAIESGISIEVGKAFRQELEAHFNSPVKYLFLTHTHSDHRNGMEAFKDVTLIASRKCIENMPTSVRLSKLTIEAFEEKFILKENDLSVEFLKVGGHSIGTSVAYFPSEKVLFAGDLLFTGGVNFNLPFLSFYQNRPRKTGNPEEYIAAFEKFKSMDIEVIVPGHGDAVFTPQELLDTHISFFKSLRSFFISAIEEGKSFEDIELPKLELIEQTFITAEARSPRSKYMRFLENYLNHLKTSFYNYYSGKF